MTYRLNEYLIVLVPEGRTFDEWEDNDAYINYHDRHATVPSLYGDDPCGYPTRICDLPAGEWLLVCKGTEVDEVMAGEMVEGWNQNSFFYRDYSVPDDHEHRDDFCDTALESYQSYLTANNLTAASIAVLKLK